MTTAPKQPDPDLILLPSDLSLSEFLARHVTSYAPATDDYDRPPFTADIKEGKNDPIYNAHSYHTKVPPRGIIPYILHYTQPGDLVLDVFCGSGMTGVAAQMCVDPPADLLAQYPELKDRVGPRACILNDLSPAACHISYNYNTPVDVLALTREFDRIKAAVQEEFNWLYGTEHYEPAVDLYDPKNPEVTSRLKNPPVKGGSASLLDDQERTWELLTKLQVEERLGYPVSELPRNDDWGNLNVTTVKHWISIPATIQYTIWSDVYRCEGFIPVEEPTGKVSTRGKNAGKAMSQTKRVARGCGKEFVLYDVAMDKETTKVKEEFKCPHCQQVWTTANVTLIRCKPCDVRYQFVGADRNSNGDLATRRVRRGLTAREQSRIQETDTSKPRYWFPKTPVVDGEEGSRLLHRGILTIDQLYTPRSLAAQARLWHEFSSVPDARVRDALRFLFTSVSARNLTRMTRYRKRGNEAMAMRLFVPHFTAELNPLKVLEGKFDDIASYFAASSFLGQPSLVSIGPAQSLAWLPDASVDFIFSDPPFGRNIAYSELNVLWEAWLGKTTDVPKEAITSNGRKWGVESYVDKMRGAFHEMFRVLKPGRYTLIEFNNGDPALGLFEHIKQAALLAGFQITNMMILDKEHKSFNQVVGVIRGEDTVDKDVIFNLQKPAATLSKTRTESHDLEHQVADAVRQHLQTLPERIKADPAKYNDEHRTTATINSMLMNTLIPQGVSVERLTLPFIERVCARYFRKFGLRWYLRGEAVGGNGGDMVHEEVTIRDELTAIAWLRQKLESRPALIGELKPSWMRATGLLPAATSQSLILDFLLSENFWRDPDTNRWREPTPEEREMMNDDRSLRVLHDAERHLAGSLGRQTNDDERCRWIDVLFQACRDIEEKQADALPALRGFDSEEAYQVITRLFQSVLKERVTAEVYRRADKQCRAASSRIAAQAEKEKDQAKAKRKDDKQTTLDLEN